MRWYDRERRELPWRQSPSAYGTLVSELMLQQTVVATVVPYFERFMRRFQDLRALASAPEDDVLASWSGLGYYRRARHLHQAARAIVQRHSGEIPRDESTLRELPGIGPYTAAAVAAIAFGARTFALDGNAARVTARLSGCKDAIEEPRARDELRGFGQALVPVDRPGDFAQAIMELGARVCVPRRPRCEECPVAPSCAAFATGETQAIPVRKARRKKRAVRLVCVAVVRGNRLLLVRRGADELLGGTWTLPFVEAVGGDRRASADLAMRNLGLSLERTRDVGEVKHVFTHLEVTATVVWAVARGRPRNDADVKFVPRVDIDALAIASFTRKMLATAVVGDAGRTTSRGKTSMGT